MHEKKQVQLAIPAFQPQELPSVDTALCNECLAPIPFALIRDMESVFLDKVCSAHGRQRVLISSDVAYYEHAQAIATRSASEKASPYMIIVEAIDHCDMECPTCIASSTPEAGNIRDPRDLIKRVEKFARLHGTLELLMVSGGEPTLHPHLLDILSGLKQFTEQLMLITNGVKIANDPAFASQLADLGSDFEVYLQFDSMRAHVLRDLRGFDCRSIREAAIENLRLNSVSATLVCVVKKGFNDDEVAQITQYAIQQPHIRGVSFQPIRSSGRHGLFDYREHSITLSEVRRRLQIDLALDPLELPPHPRNPDNLCVGYFSRDFRSMSKMVFEQLPACSKSKPTPLYLSRRSCEDRCNDPSLFRIAIVQFLDQFNYTSGQSRRGGIMFLDDTGEIIPLDRRFLFPNQARSPELMVNETLPKEPSQ